MKKHIDITVEEELIKKAKLLGLNISDFVDTSLSAYLEGVPDAVIKKYVALDKAQKGKVRRKLIRISREMFGGES